MDERRASSASLSDAARPQVFPEGTDAKGTEAPMTTREAACPRKARSHPGASRVDQLRERLERKRYVVDAHELAARMLRRARAPTRLN